MDTTIILFIIWVSITVIILGFAMASFIMSLIQQKRLDELES